MKTKTYYAEDICKKSTVLGSFTNGKYRLVNLETRTPELQHKNVIVQFSRGGNISNTFGVSKNQYGKTMLTFAVGDHEASKFREWEDFVIHSVVERKDELWLGKNISESQIRDNFARLISEKKLMKDGGGYWPGLGKIGVPHKKDTGEVDCVIVDDKNKPIDLYDVMGRRWKTIIVKIAALYFSGKYICGFGPKSLQKLVVESEEEPQEIEVLPPPPPIETVQIPKVKKRKLNK
jgi:hypothetical protein